MCLAFVFCSSSSRSELIVDLLLNFCIGFDLIFYLFSDSLFDSALNSFWRFHLLALLQLSCFCCCYHRRHRCCCCRRRHFCMSYSISCAFRIAFAIVWRHSNRMRYVQMEERPSRWPVFQGWSNGVINLDFCFFSCIRVVSSSSSSSFSCYAIQRYRCYHFFFHLSVDCVSTSVVAATVTVQLPILLLLWARARRGDFCRFDSIDLVLLCYYMESNPAENLQMECSLLTITFCASSTINVGHNFNQNLHTCSTWLAMTIKYRIKSCNLIENLLHAFQF